MQTCSKVLSVFIDAPKHQCCIFKENGFCFKKIGDAIKSYHLHVNSMVMR